MANRTKKPRYIGVELPLSETKVIVYSSPRLADAFKEISMDLTLYKGVKLSQILEALYGQGKKDGARLMVDAMNAKMEEAKLLVPHKKPGRPKKS